MCPKQLTLNVLLKKGVVDRQCQGGGSCRAEGGVINPTFNPRASVGMQMLWWWTMLGDLLDVQETISVREGRPQNRLPIGLGTDGELHRTRSPDWRIGGIRRWRHQERAGDGRDWRMGFPSVVGRVQRSKDPPMHTNSSGAGRDHFKNPSLRKQTSRHLVAWMLLILWIFAILARFNSRPR